MNVKIYYYRGQIERGKTYKWVDGYSENSENGLVTYPWATRKECRIAAKKENCKAKFIKLQSKIYK